GSIPWNERDVPVLRFMSSNATQKIPTAGGERNTTTVAKLKVFQNGTVHVTYITVFKDKYNAGAYQAFFSSSSKEQIDASMQPAAEGFCKDYKNLEYTGSDLNANGNVTVKMDFDCPLLAVAKGNKITIAKYDGTDLEVPEYLASATERTYDFNLGPTVYYKAIINLEFPEGFKVTTDIAPVRGGYENYTKTLDYSKQGNTAKLVFNAYSGPFVSKDGFASMKGVSTSVFNALKPIQAVAETAAATPINPTAVATNSQATPANNASTAGASNNNILFGIVALAAIIAIGYYLLKAKPEKKGGKKIKSKKGKKRKSVK
ncbi:MAG: hypothetical protein WC408_05235, partial [Candidatus Micrarchaeia archaeon]